MPKSSSSSNSPLSDVPINLDTFLPESSTATNTNSVLSPANAFTAIRSSISRKRAPIYIKVERDAKRPRTSAVWAHGREVQLENSRDGRRFWDCNLCYIKLTASATTNAVTHLRRVHNIRIDSQPLSPFLLTVIDQQRQGVELQQAQNSSISQNLSLQERLIRFVTICRIPHNVITSKHFQSLFLCSPTATTEILPYLPTSHNTVQAWTQKEFDRAQNKVRNMLRKSLGKINISFDL
jgi:BED zinc finger